MKNLEIKIDRPCSENWESFVKRGLNGFCSKCEKEVVDFTRMSDREIRNYFLNYSNTEVCGRMRRNQQKEYLPSRRSSMFSRFNAGVLTLGSMIFGTVSVLAQSSDKIEIAPISNDHLINLDPRIISGKVTDENEEGLPGATVIIKGTTKGTLTDIEGNFEIKVSPEDILVFSFIGFEDQERNVGQNSTMNVSLGGGVSLLGEVVMLGGIDQRWYTPRSLWWRMKGLFTRKY